MQLIWEWTLMVKKTQVELKTQLPTVLAMTIAAEAGLLQYDPNFIMKPDDRDQKQYNEKLQSVWMQRLRMFQQMALSGAKLAECKVVYHGFKLEQMHNKALRIIYKHTASWVKGFVMDELLKIMPVGGVDSVAIATLVQRLLNADSSLTPAAVGKGKKGEYEVTARISIDTDDAQL